MADSNADTKLPGGNLITIPSHFNVRIQNVKILLFNPHIDHINGLGGGGGCRVRIFAVKIRAQRSSVFNQIKFDAWKNEWYIIMIRKKRPAQIELTIACFF